jgi:hypothetical protein
MKKRNKINNAYFAGIFDGEGHISITKYKDGVRGQKYFGMQMAIGTVNQEIATELKNYFGGGIYINKSGKRLVYLWWVKNRKIIKDFLDAVYPYLIIKKEHIKKAFEFLSLPVHHYRKAEIREEIHLLNRPFYTGEGREANLKEAQEKRKQ